jgi:cyclophilin family peptidyl-prolyl cis-trans isomerase
MRRSQRVLGSSKGFGWYTKFVEKGEASFQKHVSPTPFDWSAPPLHLYKNSKVQNIKERSRAFFDLRVDKDDMGRLVFELADDIVPATVENFKSLCLGKGEMFNRGYKGTKIHQIIKGVAIMGGDIERNDGTGNYSATKERHFKDENFIIPHSHRGLLSMASIGVNSNGSQFYIGLGPNPHMNGRCVVFGRMVAGDEVVAAVEKIFTFRGAPSRDLIINDCGMIQ